VSLSSQEVSLGQLVIDVKSLSTLVNSGLIVAELV
jgi:hypothetical protein